MMIIKRSVIVLSVFLVTLSSCFENLVDRINNIEDLRWNPTLAVPLGGGSFTIDDFTDELEGEEYSITAQEDGLMVFNYTVNEVFSTTANELIEIEDEAHTILLQPDLSLIPDLSIPVTGNFGLSETHAFDVSPPDGDQLYQLLIKEGILAISAAGNFPGSGDLLITFERVTKNNIPLEVAFQWAYDGTNEQRLERDVDLQGYEIDYTDDGATSNFIGFETSLSISVDNQLISLSDGLEVELGFRSLAFSHVFAHVQPRSIAAERYEMTFDFMDDIAFGNYYFDEPSITINISNSFGVPVQIAIPDLVARSEGNGMLAMTGDIVDTPQPISYPAFENIGQTEHTTITIDHENSNLPAVIAWQPDTISYSFEGSVNEDELEAIHFVLDTSRIKATMEMEIPWIGRIEDIAFEDSIDFQASDLEDIDEEIARALFRLTTLNGFAVNATVQLYFVSDEGLVIDSLFQDDERILEAGQLDASGRVSQPALKEIDVVADHDRLARIADATTIVIKAQLSTPENETRSIRIFNDDRLDFSLFVQTEFEIVF